MLDSKVSPPSQVPVRQLGFINTPRWNPIFKGSGRTDNETRIFRCSSCAFSSWTASLHPADLRTRLCMSCWLAAFGVFAWLGRQLRRHHGRSRIRTPSAWKRSSFAPGYQNLQRLPATTTTACEPRGLRPRSHRRLRHQEQKLEGRRHLRRGQVLHFRESVADYNYLPHCLTPSNSPAANCVLRTAAVAPSTGRSMAASWRVAEHNR